MEPHWQYPEFVVTQINPPRHAYAVCVFLINEGARIRAQLRKMKSLAQEVDIILADGGSTDGALDPALLKACGVCTLLTKRGPGKLSAQMRMAMAHCLDHGYEGIIVVDGNDKDDTSAVPLFVKALEAGYDHVQGSRYIPGGQAVNTPFLRHWGVQILHAPLIALASGFRYTDTTNGFRAYSRRFLLDPQVQPFREVFQRYELHYYLAIRAARLGFKVTEVPVTRSYPVDAPAPTKISPVRGNMLVLKTLFSACLGKWDVDERQAGDR
ncbi:MAG: glycosyltransferase family 2 protein [Verrucomicrobiaceae bacterium]|nr:glycosyltransferase family 2 protein [Verrucomicrobiaceae bacterium]